ncbi:DUF4232 domain-containing protein [Aeromicrobium endophyticum]|nr:DUF4232 domain-containing protein [Aeromicrobium endophyticum]
MTIIWRLRPGALACLGLVLVLSACSSSDQTSAAPSSTTSAGQASPPASSPAPGSATPASPGPSSSPSPTASSGGTPTCRAGQLRVSYADDADGGAAGSVYGHLVLTSTSTSPCAMTGWPGVSYVGGGDGHQLGAAADRTDRTGSPAVIVLVPGGSAAARLQQAQAGNFEGSCSPAQADGFRVYPPNSRTAVFVEHAAQACRSGSAHLLTIGPVIAR